MQNGVVVQVAAASEYADLEAFGRAVAALPLEFSLEPVPTVKWRTLRGSMLEFTYGHTPMVNGRVLDYAGWPLFGGPFLDAAVDSERLTIKYGAMRRTLDFKSLTVSNH